MKNLFVFLLLCTLATTAFSQVSIGLSASANQSFWKWQIKDPSINLNYEPAIGWRSAVMGEWQISPIVGVRAEFGKQVKRNKDSKLEITDDTGAPIDAKGSENYQFWEGSLLMQISPIKKFPNTYLLAGATYGRLTNACRVIKGGIDLEGGNKSNFDIDIENSFYNKNAHATDFGLGSNIPLGKTSSLKIEGRFQYSLSNLSTSDNVEASISPLMLTVGYLHRL